MKLGFMKILCAAVALTVPAMAQDVASGTIKISQGWSRPAPSVAPVLGGFLTITNEGKEPDRLTGVTSPVSDDVQIHQTTIESDRASMRRVEGGIEVPAGYEIKFGPGGFHIMFMNPKKRPAAGEVIPLQLTFEKAGKIDAELLVSSKQPATITHGAGHKQ